MKINIISYEPVDSWILGKFATELEKHLLELGQDVMISSRARKDHEINHHIIYTGYDSKVTNTDTIMITHIDYVEKVRQVKKQMRHAKAGICMSKETMNRLASVGIPRRKLCYVNPARNDRLRPRKIVIGITSRLYGYRLKREHFLLQLTKHIDADSFKFIIMGSGWEHIVSRVKNRGFEIVYHPDFDVHEYGDLMSRLDYYLYMGEDEGSMGFVDALSCGVKTITTPQGYHLDAKGGLTHSFRTLTGLVRIFKGLQADRLGRTQSVRDWTWGNYARKHLRIWQYLLNKNPDFSSESEDGLNSLINPNENFISEKDAWRSILKANFRLEMAALEDLFIRAVTEMTPDRLRVFLKKKANGIRAKNQERQKRES